MFDIEFLGFLFILALIISLLTALYYKFKFNEPIIKNFVIIFPLVVLGGWIISTNFFQEDLKIASYQFSFSLKDVLLFLFYLYIIYLIINYLFKLIGKVFGFSSESQSSEKSYRKFSSYEEAVRVQNYKPKSFRQMLNDYFWIIVIVVGILIMTILYYIYSPYQNCLRIYSEILEKDKPQISKELSEDKMRDALGRDLTKEEKDAIYSINEKKKQRAVVGKALQLTSEHLIKESCSNKISRETLLFSYEQFK
tara:strand:- start:114 stop:869 length:756 start_codon:yes stop_codon:yes gene_type:complete